MLSGPASRSSSAWCCCAMTGADAEFPMLGSNAAVWPELPTPSGLCCTPTKAHFASRCTSTRELDGALQACV
jgi:hypothetical protein